MKANRPDIAAEVQAETRKALAELAKRKKSMDQAEWVLGEAIRTRIPDQLRSALDQAAEAGLRAEQHLEMDRAAALLAEVEAEAAALARAQPAPRDPADEQAVELSCTPEESVEKAQTQPKP